MGVTLSQFGFEQVEFTLRGLKSLLLCVLNLETKLGAYCFV